LRSGRSSEGRRRHRARARLPHGRSRPLVVRDDVGAGEDGRLRPPAAGRRRRAKRAALIREERPHDRTVTARTCPVSGHA
jgi:hypothetical protein